MAVAVVGEGETPTVDVYDLIDARDMRDDPDYDPRDLDYSNTNVNTNLNTNTEDDNSAFITNTFISSFNQMQSSSQSQRRLSIDILQRLMERIQLQSQNAPNNNDESKNNNENNDNPNDNNIQSQQRRLSINMELNSFLQRRPSMTDLETRGIIPMGYFTQSNNLIQNNHQRRESIQGVVPIGYFENPIDNNTNDNNNNNANNEHARRLSFGGIHSLFDNNDSDNNDNNNDDNNHNNSMGFGYENRPNVDGNNQINNNNNEMNNNDNDGGLSADRRLQLAERANEIYRQQLRYMQDHLTSLRSLIQDKENIIENLMLRFDLGIINQDNNRNNGNSSIETDEEKQELRSKAEALAQRTILENFELREMVNELRDENFHLRNEIYELQDKINRQALQINRLERENVGNNNNNANEEVLDVLDFGIDNEDDRKANEEREQRERMEAMEAMERARIEALERVQNRGSRRHSLIEARRHHRRESSVEMPNLFAGGDDDDESEEESIEDDIQMERRQSEHQLRQLRAHYDRNSEVEHDEWLATMARDLLDGMD